MEYACGKCGVRGPTRYCPRHTKRRQHGPGSTARWRKLRATVLRRDGYRCMVRLADGSVCGAPAPLGGPNAGHADHITPKALGGTDHPSNLRAACAPCNLRKGARAEEVHDG